MAQLERLVCLDCAQRISSYPDSMDPDFNETLIEGTLIPRRIPGVMLVNDVLHHIVPNDVYICDQCNAEMPLISHAVAWTQWRSTHNKEGWEHNFLTDMRIIKEVKR